MQRMEISAPDFDLEKTLDSGQVFHWEKIGKAFVGTIGEWAVCTEQRGEVLCARVASPSRRSLGRDAQDADATIFNYFALDHPLADICASFPDDPVMNAARQFCRGLRIIRQPKWECLATFICSSMKQVAHIRQISLALRRRFGDRRKVGDHVAHTFPLAQRIASASEKDLRECALGYRAKNLLATARLVSSGRISNRRLDRKGFETTVFSAEEKNHGTAVARIFGNVFWRTRRLRAAIPVSSRADRLAEVRSIERFLQPSHKATAWQATRLGMTKRVASGWAKIKNNASQRTGLLAQVVRPCRLR